MVKKRPTLIIHKDGADWATKTSHLQIDLHGEDNEKDTLWLMGATAWPDDWAKAANAGVDALMQHKKSIDLGQNQRNALDAFYADYQKRTLAGERAGTVLMHYIAMHEDEDFPQPSMRKAIWLSTLDELGIDEWCDVDGPGIYRSIEKAEQKYRASAHLWLAQIVFQALNGWGHPQISNNPDLQCYRVAQIARFFQHLASDYNYYGSKKFVQVGWKYPLDPIPFDDITPFLNDESRHKLSNYYVWNPSTL